MTVATEGGLIRKICCRGDDDRHPNLSIVAAA
jgi:hypothetical protein